MPAAQVFEKAKDAGHARSAVNAAKKKLPIETNRVGGKDGKWQWALREEPSAKPSTPSTP